MELGCTTHIPDIRPVLLIPLPVLVIEAIKINMLTTHLRKRNISALQKTTLRMEYVAV